MSRRARTRPWAAHGHEPPSGGPRGWVLLGVVLLGFNLRPSAVSVGPVLHESTSALGLSAIGAGVLTALPVLCFAVFGGLAPRLAHGIGLHRATLLATLTTTAGLATRPLVDDAIAFLLLTVVANAGTATANVLLPSLVKRHFPGQVGRVTAAYSTALAVGLTLSSVLTVPIAAGFGGWRSGLLAWSFTAGVAALPWLVLVGADKKAPGSPTGTHSPSRPWGLADVARTRLGWAMAVLFGAQSFQAYAIFGWFAQVYRDAGFSPATAGLLLGVITGVSIPLSVLFPVMAARTVHPRGLLLAITACFPLGYAGLLLAPVAGAWLWAVLVGVGASVFPLVLALIGLRSRTPEGTAALSGFTQAAGYVVSVTGPLVMGVLYDATGAWTVPLLLLVAVNVPQVLAGLRCVRPGAVEDELTVSARGHLGPQ